MNGWTSQNDDYNPFTAMKNAQSRPYVTPDEFWNLPATNNSFATSEWGGPSGVGQMDSDTGFFAPGNANTNFTPNVGGGGPMGGIGNWWQQMTGTSQVGEGGPNFLQGMMGGFDQSGNSFKGWGGGALDLGKNIFGAVMGYKNYKMAKNELDFRKEAWSKDYGARKHDYNQSTIARNAALKSQDPGAYQRETLK
jgi:hypothetical protein